MKKIYLCRHGTTEWTLSGKHTGKTDISLTEEGKREAACLRKELECVFFERIFSSPRLRAIQTCEGLHPVIDPDLAEWDYGDYEGLTSQQIHQKRPNWNVFDQGVPGGESPQDVGARADRFLKKLSGIEGNVAIFSHGHFLRVLAARFLGLAPEWGRALLLSVASLSILSYENQKPVISLWNQGTSSMGGDGQKHAKG